MPRLLTLRSDPGYTKTYCIFPHAGGIASFKSSWSPYFQYKSRVICVEYPGRGIAIQDPVCEDFRNLSQLVFELITKALDQNTVFIGESMGGYLAFDVAKKLYLKIGMTASGMLLTSVGSPEKIAERANFLLGSSKEEAQRSIIERIFSGLNPWSEMDVETQHYLFELLLNDIHLLTTYRNVTDIKISIPLMVINGESDLLCHNQDVHEFWKNNSSGRFSYSTFKGHHNLTPENIDNIMCRFETFIRHE